MATFLVTGATGFVGSRLVDLALEQGHRVHTLTRSDWSGSPAVRLADRYFGLLPNQIPLQALAGVDVVVHCAAATEANEASSFAVNVNGTLNLARAALAAGAGSSFIFISSQSAQPEATSAYGRSKYAAERALLALKGINVVVLRPGLVCGSGSRGLFQKMCDMVEKLPVLPLLGGSRAVVQPIHVNDLCAGILECANRSKELAGSVLNLGDPTGISLAEFLQLIAKHRLGKNRTALHVPLWPIEKLVLVTERLGIPLPINTNNLKGLKQVSRMDTAADMEKIGIHPRSIEGMFASAGPESSDISLDRRAVRVVLIGGGRIGLVHALTLWRSHGIDFAGIIDTKRGALNLLKGMGLPVATFTSAQEAIRTVRADAAVIATPPSTHLPLARMCLSEGLSVLVEKPLSIRKEQLEEFRQFALEFPTHSIQVGYVMPRNPQVEHLIRRLRAGEFGKVTAFLGISLHAYIVQPEPQRWEVTKAISGGGVLINSGGHVLSMIHAAFGSPLSVEAQSRQIHSAEVEDSLVATLHYDDFHGQHCASWSIKGFQRQENRLVVWTERGTLILTASAGLFFDAVGSSEICHQLDFDVGFNLAPDYAGAGFSREIQDLAGSVRSGQPAPMNVLEAIAIEEILHRIYAETQLVSSFAVEMPEREVVAKPAEDRAIAQTKRYLDLREIPSATIERYLAGGPSNWNGYEITSTQLTEVSSLPPPTNLRVTIPDFLVQSRLLMGGQYVAVLKRMGISGMASAGLTAFPMIAGARSVTFWAAAMALLAGDLARVPSRFDGTLLLHGYLTDLALALRQTLILEKMLSLCRRLRPRARIGLHTNLAGEIDAVLPLMSVRLDEISVLTSPSGLGLKEIIDSLRVQTSSTSVTAEVGPGPAVMHRIAAHQSDRWTHGTNAILLGPMADYSLADSLEEEKRQAWVEAFPGLHMPKVIL